MRPRFRRFAASQPQVLLFRFCGDAALSRPEKTPKKGNLGLLFLVPLPKLEKELSAPGDLLSFASFFVGEIAPDLSSLEITLS